MPEQNTADLDIGRVLVRSSTPVQFSLQPRYEIKTDVDADWRPGESPCERIGPFGSVGVGFDRGAQNHKTTAGQIGLGRRPAASAPAGRPRSLDYRGLG